MYVCVYIFTDLYVYLISIYLESQILVSFVKFNSFKISLLNNTANFHPSHSCYFKYQIIFYTHSKKSIILKVLLLEFKRNVFVRARACT